MVKTKFATDVPGLHVLKSDLKFRPWQIIHTASGAVVISVKRLRQARALCNQVSGWADWTGSVDYLIGLNIARRVRALAAELEDTTPATIEAEFDHRNGGAK